jgi:ubiquitin carboxyl-terminal hydrolase 10
VNSENTSFANAVLQLLVHCPPFWNLFRELGGQMGQQGLGQGQGVGRGATPLVDAKVKFLDEFVYKEELSVTQALQQPSAERGEARENKEGMKGRGVVDSFNPGYMYDAMKEKRQLKSLLVRSCARDALFC